MMVKYISRWVCYILLKSFQIVEFLGIAAFARSVVFTQFMDPLIRGEKLLQISRIINSYWVSLTRDQKRRSAPASFVQHTPARVLTVLPQLVLQLIGMFFSLFEFSPA